jgi:hypothetical protein
MCFDCNFSFFIWKQYLSHAKMNQGMSEDKNPNLLSIIYDIKYLSNGSTYDASN